MYAIMHSPLTTVRRRAGALAIAAAFALLIVSLGPTPADAKSSFMYRASGVSASTDWTQIDGTPTGSSPLGNVHIGQLYAYETTKGKAEAYGYIEDWDCEEGQLPWGGGPHDVSSEEWDEEPPPETGCEWKGFRFVEAYDIPFTVDKKLTQARLTGTLTVYGGGHGDGGVIGRPYADIIWTGVGSLATVKETFRYREDGTSYSFTRDSSTRSATMSGIMGPMGFDPDFSSGSISSYKESSKTRTK